MTFHDWSDVAVAISLLLMGIIGSLLTLLWLWWVNRGTR